MPPLQHGLQSSESQSEVPSSHQLGQPAACDIGASTGLTKTPFSQQALQKSEPQVNSSHHIGHERLDGPSSAAGAAASRLAMNTPLLQHEAHCIAWQVESSHQAGQSSPLLVLQHGLQAATSQLVPSHHAGQSGGSIWLLPGAMKRPCLQQGLQKSELQLLVSHHSGQLPPPSPPCEAVGL